MDMGNAAGVRRDFAALEARRMAAARLLREGLSQSEVARELGVHRQSVSRWARELGQSGVRGLRQAGRTGRPPKLGPAQLRDLERTLKRGPEALGYATGLWTAGRVRDLIVNAELSCHFFADADVPRLTNSLFIAP
jgi:transposase